MTFGAPLTSVALLIAERSHEDISSSAHNRSNQRRSRQTQKQKGRPRRIPDRGRRRRRNRRRRDEWMGHCSIDPSISLAIHCFDSEVGYSLPALAEDDMYVSLAFKTNSHRLSRSWEGETMLSYCFIVYMYILVVLLSVHTYIHTYIHTSILEMFLVWEHCRLVCCWSYAIYRKQQQTSSSSSFVVVVISGKFGFTRTIFLEGKQTRSQPTHA